MSQAESISVVQAGLTGPVADIFRQIIAQPNVPLTLEAVAASRPEHIGKTLGEVGMATAAELVEVPIISMEDAVHNTDSPVVFSSLRSESAAEYEDQLAAGRLLATNASPNRMRPDVALLNAYINGHQLDELYSVERPGYIMANGNCMSIIPSLAMAPLHKAFGVKAANVETSQGWSGAGVMEVPEEYEGRSTPIKNKEKEKIEAEPRKFLGSMDRLADIAIDATPMRATWVTGHYAKINLTLDESATYHDAMDVWEEFRAPTPLEAAEKYGDFMPQRSPINVMFGSLLEPTEAAPDGERSDPPRRIINAFHTNHPMRVMASVEPVAGFQPRLEIEVVGNNLVLGAAGSSIMNILYAKEMGYLG